MPPPPVLKRKHSLKGKSLIPLIKRFHKWAGDLPEPLARMRMNLATENMSCDDVVASFRELTGESEKDIIEMGPKDMSEENMKLLLHITIMYANEVGAPQGQQLEQVQDDESAMTSPAKKQKTDASKVTLEERIRELESQSRKEAGQEMKVAKDKVVDVDIVVPEWERGLEFCPLKAVGEKRQHPIWLTLGEDDTKPVVHVRAESVIKTPGLDCELSTLLLRDPDYFVAGNLHHCQDEWEHVLSQNNDVKSTEVRNWIRNGVDVVSFFRHFKGNFKGRSYDSIVPVRQYFHNSNSCQRFSDFIMAELNERVRNGSMILWGRVGEVEPPKVILPLTIEPTKPRLCYDARYINLWTKDLPFTLETLRDVHRLVSPQARMICCDEKSGYDHVHLTRESQTYFGVQFGGWLFSYTTLAFGWKASPYIYQTIGMQVTSYLRFLGMLTIQYIDDRIAIAAHSGKDGIQCDVMYNDMMMAYVLLEILTRLGYTLSIKKCQLTPSTRVRYLGFLVDSVKQAYLLPDDKKHKFIELRERILALKEVSFCMLQRFAGKCISMALVVPAAQLYTREVNRAISYGIKNSRRVQVDGSLRQEIEYWRFLDTWQGYSVWRPERHHQLVLATDASSFRYGVSVLSGPKRGLSFGDFWDNSDTRPIHLKEASAVLKALQSLGSDIVNHRLDILTDNMAVLYAWQNQGAKDKKLNDIMKDIFQFICSSNIDLHMQYVSSENNQADAPSRTVSYTDCMLQNETWQLVETNFGPHTIDLMATDANVMSVNGRPIKHYTLYPSPGSSGINVFAQDLTVDTNPYVFPPFNLVFPILSLLREQRIPSCTIVVPVLEPLPMWWPLLLKHCVSYIVLGHKGDKHILRIPTKKGFVSDNFGLRWHLRACRLKF